MADQSNGQEDALGVGGWAGGRVKMIEMVAKKKLVESEMAATTARLAATEMMDTADGAEQVNCLVDQLELSMKFLTVLVDEEMELESQENDMNMVIEQGSQDEVRENGYMDWEEGEVQEHKFMDGWRQRLGVRNDGDVDDEVNGDKKYFTFGEEYMAHLELDKILIESDSGCGSLPVEHLSSSQEHMEADGGLGDGTQEDDDNEDGVVYDRSGAGSESSRGGLPVGHLGSSKEQMEADGGLGAGVRENVYDRCGAEWYGQMATWYLDRWLPPGKVYDTPCKVGGRGENRENMVCAQTDILCAHARGGAKIMSHRVVVGESVESKTNDLCTGKRKRRSTGWWWPSSRWAGGPRATSNWRPRSRRRISTECAESSTNFGFNGHSDKDIIKNILVPGGDRMAKDHRDNTIMLEDVVADNMAGPSSSFEKTQTGKPGHISVSRSVKELPGKPVLMHHTNLLLTGDHGQPGQVHEEEQGGAHSHGEVGQELHQPEVVHVNEQMDKQCDGEDHTQDVQGQQEGERELRDGLHSQAVLPLQQHHDGGVRDGHVRPGEGPGVAEHHQCQAVQEEQQHGVQGQLPRHDGALHDGEHGVQQNHVLNELQHVDDGGAVRRKLDTVKLRKTRGMVPDGLVQVRISNFLQSFPNLGRGPSMWMDNCESSDSELMGLGIRKRKSLDQLGDPSAQKRLRE